MKRKDAGMVKVVIAIEERRKIPRVMPLQSHAHGHITKTEKM